MAAITSAKSGNWSATDTWVGGVVPTNGDTVTIASGHVVTFDVDQSGFASGLAGLTITGELQASTTAGAYVLKMAGSVTGTGVLRAGTDTTPYPTACSFSILLNGNYKVNLTGNGSIQLYAADPTYKVIGLSQAASAGATVLNVNTNVTGDIWAAGNLIRVDDIAGTLPDSEERTIAAGGITATTITITAGLTNAKTAGSKVILISRNVKIVGPSSSSGTGVDTPTGGVSRCEIRNVGNGINQGSGHIVSGTISGCTTGINQGSGLTLLSALLTGNTQDIINVAEFRAHNTQFLSATEFNGYNSTNRTNWHYAESFDHDAVAGTYKAWTRGGITVKQTSVIPPSGAWAYNLLPESATYPVFVQEIIMAQPGQWTYVNGWLRKDASMSYLPRLQLVLPTSDPLVDSTKTPQVERIMTDSVDTWEPFALAYFNSSAMPVRLVIRALAKNATGNVYAYWRVQRQPVVMQ